jgi:hypothetical protein
VLRRCYFMPKNTPSKWLPIMPVADCGDAHFACSEPGDASVNHRLATKKQVSLSLLKDETFVRGSDDAVPGYTQRIVQLCRKYGGFRPRLVTIGGATGLVESLALSANEDAIAIQPIFISHLKVSNVAMVPIADAGATWDLFIVWQRGKAAGPLRTLLSELNLKSE